MQKFVYCGSFNYSKSYKRQNNGELGEKYPDYDFAKNKGYGTKHVEAIKKYGVIDGIHRKSFLGRYYE